MNYAEFVEAENCFAIIDKVNKKNKTKLIKQSEQDAIIRRQKYLKVK